MTVRPIRLYPDPVLKRVAPTVDLVTQHDQASRVVRDLLDTLQSFGHSVGLAAPQLGELTRVVVVDCSKHRKARVNHGLLTLINPEIVEQSGNEVGREGCLSIPDLTANVRRSTRIIVTATDLLNNRIRIESEGFEARAIQHEIDHLDGVLFLDRVASLDHDVFQRKRYS